MQLIFYATQDRRDINQEDLTDKDLRHFLDPKRFEPLLVSTNLLALQQKLSQEAREPLIFEIEFYRYPRLNLLSGSSEIFVIYPHLDNAFKVKWVLASHSQEGIDYINLRKSSPPTKSRSLQEVRERVFTDDSEDNIAQFSLTEEQIKISEEQRAHAVLQKIKEEINKKAQLDSLLFFISSITVGIAFGYSGGFLLSLSFLSNLGVMLPSNFIMSGGFSWFAGVIITFSAQKVADLFGYLFTSYEARYNLIKANKHEQFEFLASQFNQFTEKKLIEKYNSLFQNAPDPRFTPNGGLHVSQPEYHKVQMLNWANYKLMKRASALPVQREEKDNKFLRIPTEKIVQNVIKRPLVVKH